MIMSDDVGITNISAYSLGMSGYRTPNIDRIADEGVLFTDYYAEQSCTAGQSAFITGQSPIRTGLTKVGFPGSSIGLQRPDPTLAEMLKPLGYASGPVRQEPFGRPQRVPAHGARLRRVLRQPLSPQRRGGAGERRLSEDPAFAREFGPRGVLDCRRHRDRERHRPTSASADGAAGMQDTGPLTRKRMETADEEFLGRAMDFIERNSAGGQEALVRLVQLTSRMHFYTHLKEESEGVTGLGTSIADGMVEHDGHVGQLLKKLDALGIADNTIVIYTDRQRPALQRMARRRHQPVPRREEHQLGGRLPRPDVRALAGQDQGATRVINDTSSAPRLGADADGGRRRPGDQG